MTNKKVNTTKMSMKKTCKDCGKDKDISTYHYADKKNGILKSYCKDCCYERAKAQIEKDPIAHEYYMRRYYKENPDRYPGNHKSKTIPAVSGVYVVECLLTNDKYVGCSSNLRHRKYVHSRGIGHHKIKSLSKLVKEYGWSAFSFDVLEICDKEVMFERETQYIQELQPNLNSYKK